MSTPIDDIAIDTIERLQAENTVLKAEVEQQRETLLYGSSFQEKLISENAIQRAALAALRQEVERLREEPFDAYPAAKEELARLRAEMERRR